MRAKNLKPVEAPAKCRVCGEVFVAGQTELVSRDMGGYRQPMKACISCARTRR